MRITVPNRLVVVAGAIFMAPILGGILHGSTPTFEGVNWHEVLEKVQCQYVTKEGKDFKIAAKLIVAGQTFENPTITEEGQIKELERKCP